MRTLGRLLPIVVGVGFLVAGCAEAPPPPPPAVPHPSGFAQGIDMARDARDYSQELKGSHLDFIARYYRDPASRWPTLTPPEAEMISATGMRLVAVWEWHSGRPDYFSYASGYADGMAAYRQAKGVGQPSGSAIYFAVDFNAHDDDIHGAIEPYFRGVHAGFQAAAGETPPDYRVGVYGSGAVCDDLKRARLADHAWLSNATAWAGYDQFTGWDIRQYRGSSGLSFDHDTNEARGEYGGFQVGTQYSAKPATPVSATASVTPASATASATPASATPSVTPVSATASATPVSATASATPASATASATPVSATASVTPVSATASVTPVSAASSVTPPRTDSVGSDQFAWLNSLFAGLQVKPIAVPAASH